jgi:hypothetical protein
LAFLSQNETRAGLRKVANFGGTSKGSIASGGAPAGVLPDGRKNGLQGAICMVVHNWMASHTGGVRGQVSGGS